MTVRRLRLSTSAMPTNGHLAELAGMLADRGGLSPWQAYWLRLAVEEITTNIASHGYRGGPGIVDILGRVDGTHVWLRTEDDGPPFDPRRHDPAPAMAADPFHRRVGGHGIHLAIGGLDGFSYDYVGGRNRNTMIMSRRAGGMANGGPDGTDHGTGRHDHRRV
jgi:serine/threonine-protein kinase RsbW